MCQPVEDGSYKASNNIIAIFCLFVWYSLEPRARILVRAKNLLNSHVRR